MTITENSNLDSEITKIESFFQSLNNINSTYLSALNDAKGLIDSAVFSDWEDGVSSKMQVMVNDYKINCIDAINADLSTGGFFALKSKIKDLIQALKECKIAYNNRVNAKRKLDSTPKQIKTKVEDSNNTHWRQDSGYGYHYELVDNPEYASVLKAYNDAVKEHNHLINICNEIIVEISNINFKSQYSQTDGLGTITEMPEFIASESNGALTADSELGEGIYKGYYDVVDSNGNTKRYDVLINKDNGNIIYGNAEEGYTIVCKSEAGNIYGGTAARSGDGSSITDYASLITDGHENSSGSNGILGFYPHSAYGYDNSIDPFTLSKEVGNVSSIPVTLGDGDVVYVDVPSFDENINSYLASSN